MISFNATADGRAELTDLFRAITARAGFLTAGGTPPPTGIGGPPSDSGVLGPAVIPDGLTVTAGVGPTLFDDRYGLAPQRPARLTPMRAFPDDALDPAQCGGDLVLQLSAGNADTVVHLHIGPIFTCFQRTSGGSSRRCRPGSPASRSPTTSARSAAATSWPCPAW